MSKKIPTIKIGDLKRELSLYPDDMDISFSGLSYYRCKQRSDSLVQIEFDEQVYLDNDGRVVVDNLE